MAGRYDEREIERLAARAREWQVLADLHPGLHEWVEFSEDAWVELEYEADELATIERREASEHTKAWSGERFILGVVGEETYSLASGVPRRKGYYDGGEDFPGIDVKGNKYWQNPYLRRWHRHPFKAAYYVLVGVDLEAHRATYVGWATRAEFQAAPTVDYGHGPTHTLMAAQLHKGLPGRPA